MINRSALLVRPKQPYVDWANSTDGPPYPEDGERTVYLAPDFYEPDEMREWLEEAFADIFEHELRLWMTDEATWPQQRDFATFEEWFGVQYDSMVLDLCDSPPQWDEE